MNSKKSFNFLEELPIVAQKAPAELYKHVGMSRQLFVYFKNQSKNGIPLKYLSGLREASGLSTEAFYKLLEKHYPSEESKPKVQP